MAIIGAESWHGECMAAAHRKAKSGEISAISVAMARNYHGINAIMAMANKVNKYSNEINNV